MDGYVYLPEPSSKETGKKKKKEGGTKEEIFILWPPPSTYFPASAKYPLLKTGC